MYVSFTNKPRSAKLNNVVHVRAGWLEGNVGK